ncbi:MAG TPA: hypothetical protein VNX47_12610, partial [Nevskia sp.]|nr:hypothetical protein [Nevskia sp.]
AELGAAAPTAQLIAYMLANADLALGHPGEARSAARGLTAAALDSVEPDNDWPARLNLQQAELAYSESPAEPHRQQLGAALAAIRTARDDDRDALYTQGAALLGETSRTAGGQATARR